MRGEVYALNVAIRSQYAYTDHYYPCIGINRSIAIIIKYKTQKKQTGNQYNYLC